jgi:hypothetical protein
MSTDNWQDFVTQSIHKAVTQQSFDEAGTTVITANCITFMTGQLTAFWGRFIQHQPTSWY